MKSADVVRLLEARHSKDAFFTEVKNGPSYGNGMLRMDAWAMAKSWSKPKSWVYEVKVSRADWLRDHKLHLYEPYANLTLVAAPNGVVLVEELPEGWGLLEVAKNGGSLRVARKAAFRQHAALPEDLYRYLLMYRVTCERPQVEPIDESPGVQQLQLEVRELRGKLQGVDDVRGALQALGLRTDLGPWIGSSVARRLRILKEAATPALDRTIRETLAKVSELQARLDEARASSDGGS